MRPRSYAALSFLVVAACAAPLTVAEERPASGPAFVNTPPLDSGLEGGDAESLGDPTDAAIAD